MTHQQGENQSGQGQPGQTPEQPQEQDAAQAQAAQAQQAAAQQQAAQAHYAQQGYGQQPQQGYAQGGQQYAQHQQQYGQQGSAPSAHGAGYPAQSGQPRARSEGNFLTDAFEPKFTKKATVKHARWYYLLVVIVVLVSWIGKTVLDFVEGAADHAGFLMGGGGYEGPFAEVSYNPWPGLYTLIVGGAIAFSLIILTRVFLENTIANSKISERAGEKDS